MALAGFYKNKKSGACRSLFFEISVEEEGVEDLGVQVDEEVAQADGEVALQKNNRLSRFQCLWQEKHRSQNTSIFHSMLHDLYET